MKDSFTELTDIFRTVFDDEELIISPSTTAKDIPAWDSLSHVSLIVTVEKVFQIRFSSSEVAALKNVGELLDLINTKKA